MIEHHPASAKDASRIHLGYALYAGRIWKGDKLVADIEELENLDASGIHALRLNEKEVTPKIAEIFQILDRRWNSQNCVEEIMKSENQH